MSQHQLGEDYMWPRIAIYGLGLATPYALKQFRPVLREVVKAGMVASNRVHGLVRAIRADIHEIAEEARAELSSDLNGDTA